MIVTGASSGIGEACAKAFSKAGALVVLAARNPRELERVGKLLVGAYLVVPCDITREEDCQALVNKTIDHFSRLDILVNNAGISMGARFM
ncbi:MAG: SDR family NAD(P)-dependent oxidoreductase, partial [Bacteroidia bacterium]